MISLSEAGPKKYESSAIYVPDGEGPVKWVAGDEYTIKISGEQSNGTLGFVLAVVPPEGGPIAHIHTTGDETFYILDGELEFLNGEEVFTIKTGDFVFVPRGTRHRFKNRTSRDAKMLFLFTPGGQEEFFLRYGDDPLPGHGPELWPIERYTPEMVAFVEELGTMLAPEEG
ncbi:cupin domain-containing protein [Streptomyces sp. ME03-5709C]|nr:cupin domain-containing protein [Streptomyces sp. ME03-5709C]